MEGPLAWEQMDALCAARGIEIEKVPKATPAQGGGYERAGGRITDKSQPRMRNPVLTLAT